jgi:hypothetical protein
MSIRGLSHFPQIQKDPLKVPAGDSASPFLFGMKPAGV